ncbi:Zinc knuckle CX2CX4HX4C [Sesbania bispinosa]|nr:Zinc knuckle CX2CX4HX4C [Sesbania bispinosa]
MGRRIGSCMGTVSESDIHEIQGKGSYIRVLVEMNISNPLIPGINAGSKKHGVFWVDFKYEKVPQFCYCCGLIGHDEDNCTGNSQNQEDCAALGPWMKAIQVGRKVSSGNPTQKKEKPAPNPQEEETRRRMAQELLDKLSGLSINSGAKQPTHEASGTQALAPDPLTTISESTQLQSCSPLTQQPFSELAQDVTPLSDMSNSTLEDRPAMRRWKRIKDSKNEGPEKENTPPLGAVKRKKKLEELYKDSYRPGKIQEIREEESILDGLLAQEEQWWSQRSRAQWLKERDKNTRFFHLKASQRKQTNWVEKITDDNGREYREESHIARVVRDRIAADMFSSLSRDFTAEEAGYRPQPNTPQTTDSQFVYELIDHGSHTWNPELVNSTFILADAEQILQIPLPSITMEDCFCWGNQKNGIYSVKTGYHFALKDSRSQDASSNPPRTPSDLHWRKLWNLPTQPKYKHFLWRLMKSSLLVRANLVRRGIQAPQLCPWCDAEPETEVHFI